MLGLINKLISKLKGKKMQDFEGVIQRLSKKNLRNLLVVSCISSAFDYFSGFPNRFPYVFPMVNQDRNAMFIRAIIYSHSNNHRKNLFTPDDAAFIFNKIVSVADKDKIDIIEDESLDAETRMAKLFSSLACSQLLFTKSNLIKRISIKYALYYLMPQKHEGVLRQKHKVNFVDIPSAMTDILRIDLKCYFLFSLFLLYGYEEKHDKLLDPRPDIKTRIESCVDNEDSLNKEKELYYYSIIIRASQLAEHLLFRYDKFEQFSRDEIKAFLNLTSEDITALRNKNRERPFQKGRISERLSPLERFPIIRVTSWDYIIPNFRYYNLAITELLRWKFQEMYKNNEFNETMGTVQELFIYEILASHFNNLTIITEKTYPRKRSEYSGPDLTLIEDNKLIVIEIKGKHITLDTRLSQDSDSLINDLEGALKALQKLKLEKIPDLYNGVSAYIDNQDQINRTKQNDPICVVIIGEGVIAMQEYVNIYANRDQEFFLNSFEYPYCIMDVATFCTMVDIAKSDSLSLYSLLKEYYEVGRNLKPKPLAAEDFGGRKYDWNNSVLFGFWEEIMNNLKSRLQQ